MTHDLRLEELFPDVEFCDYGVVYGLALGLLCLEGVEERVNGLTVSQRYGLVEERGVLFAFEERDHALVLGQSLRHVAFEHDHHVHQLLEIQKGKEHEGHQIG